VRQAHTVTLTYKQQTQTNDSPHLPDTSPLTNCSTFSHIPATLVCPTNLALSTFSASRRTFASSLRLV
jgi:hypothetical protein